jgi:hypothetical protein
MNSFSAIGNERPDMDQFYMVFSISPNTCFFVSSTCYSAYINCDLR